MDDLAGKFAEELGAPDRDTTLAEALGNPDSSVSKAYLDAGLSGLRLAPSALGTAALALPVAIHAATDSGVEMGWFISAAIAAIVGIFGLSAAAYYAAVGGVTGWIKPLAMIGGSFASTTAAVVFLIIGVAKSLPTI